MATNFSTFHHRAFKPMHRITHRLSKSLVSRLGLLALVCALGLQIGTASVRAQDNGSSMSVKKKKQLRNQIKRAYAKGAKAGQSENFKQAATNFQEALRLARQHKEPLKLTSRLISKIEGNLLSVFKGAGSAALKNENYGEALSHFEKAMEYTENGPALHYNRGLALVNMDSTEAGLQSLQKAIEVGNETGNTRVAGTATERIQDEFLAKASKALQGDNPSEEQINTAIEALDRMRKYVEPNAKSLYYRSRAHLKARRYEQAIQTARRGLDMHQGSRSDAAKYYFVVAESQKQLGSKAEACETYQNATYGDYKARAEHYLKNECQ